MKKFTLTLFYEGDVYNANTFVESVDIYSFVSLYRALCRSNSLPLKGPEVVYFDFDFVSDDVLHNPEDVELENSNGMQSPA